MWSCRTFIALLKVNALDVSCLSLSLMDRFPMSCVAKKPCMYAVASQPPAWQCLLSRLATWSVLLPAMTLAYTCRCCVRFFFQVMCCRSVVTYHHVHMWTVSCWLNLPLLGSSLVLVSWISRVKEFATALCLHVAACCPLCIFDVVPVHAAVCGSRLLYLLRQSVCWHCVVTLCVCRQHLLGLQHGRVCACADKRFLPS